MPGFFYAPVPQPQSALHLTFNSLRRRIFRRARYGWSFPVVAGCGSGQQGQLRDKLSAFFVWFSLIVLTTLLATTVNVGRRKGGGQDDLDRINAGLDRIHADYLAKLADTPRKTRGTAYARFSTPFQDNIADQIRFILDWAAAR